MDRVEDVCQRVSHLLENPDAPLPPYRKTWTKQSKTGSASVLVLPTNVVFDNHTSDRYTILSVFAYDRTGMLHQIAVSIADSDLVLHFAKIDTHLDQIADVFYVTELDGRKVESEERQERIRSALMAVANPPD